MFMAFFRKKYIARLLMFVVLAAFVTGVVSLGPIYTIIIAIILSYLLGAIPFGYLVGKLWSGVDVREHGSQNIGFTNVLRVVGRVPGAIVLILDIGKGVAAVLGIARLGVVHPEILPILCGIAAIIGHNWPVYLKFKGGKGVATTIGAFIALTPAATLISITVWFITVWLTRYVSLGSILFVICLPITVSVLGYIAGWNTHTTALLACAVLVAILATYRHKSNIARLLNGTERKIGQKENH